MPQDEIQPLIQTAIANAIQQANAGQTLDGQIELSSGVYVDHLGLHTPDEIAGNISLQKFRSFVLLGMALALLSGASGFEGAALQGGNGIGIGAWGSTSGLNFDGWMQFMLYLLTQGLSFSCGLVLATITGFMLAAMPPAVLAGKGAIETFWQRPTATEAMSVPKWIVGAGFGGVNLGVSGALNTISLLRLPVGIYHTGKRLMGFRQVWDNKWVDWVWRAGLGLLVYPCAMATFLATMSRGADTYQLSKSVLYKSLHRSDQEAVAGAYSVLGLTGLPGFGMFLFGLLKLTLFVESVIHFIIVTFPGRAIKTIKMDIALGVLAFGIAVGFAYFIIENYLGLSDASYSEDWAYANIIPHIVRGLGISEEHSKAANASMAAAAAGANLLQRSVNFGSYFKAMRRFIMYRRSSDEIQARDISLAQTISEAYKAQYPNAVSELATFAKNINEGMLYQPTEESSNNINGVNINDSPA